jgi:hypothetical protein
VTTITPDFDRSVPHNAGKDELITDGGRRGVVGPG